MQYLNFYLPTVTASNSTIMPLSLLSSGVIKVGLSKRFYKAYKT